MEPVELQLRQHQLEPAAGGEVQGDRARIQGEFEGKDGTFKFRGQTQRYLGRSWGRLVGWVRAHAVDAFKRHMMHRWPPNGISPLGYLNIAVPYAKKEGNERSHICLLFFTRLQ